MSIRLLHMRLRWEVSQETTADYAVVEELVRQAFEHEAMSDHTEHKLVGRLRKSSAFKPELSLVARNSEQIIVGHILLTEIKVGSYTLLSLAPLSVHPSFQRQGVGSALIKAALYKAQALGYAGIVVLGHKDYYPRFGYVKASGYDIHLPFDVPDEYAMVIELSHGALENVSGMVEYPPEFGL